MSARYAGFDPAVPVTCVTPGIGGAIHRFHDTSPFSPSGRYLAMTRFAFEDRLPPPGTSADILVADLESGEVRTVATTLGADTQLGAQVQWGADDASLFFNDVDTSTWRPYGVRLDPATGERARLAGSVYCISPDGRTSASPCLLRTRRTQAGYGVIVPREHIPQNRGAPADDGVYLTDTHSGEQRLLVSLADIVAATFTREERETFDQGAFYGFHAKWNPQGTRLMFIVRWLSPVPGQPRLNNVITMRADGSDIQRPITDRHWRRGGHHPNWCPDGERVLMNLNLAGTGLRLVAARYDGADLHMLNERLVASGHPTMHPDGIHVLTDAYVSEPLAYRDGTTPIRWLDLAATRETELVRIRTAAPYAGPAQELRVDSHPAWDRMWRRFAFNACPEGRRQVFVADMSALVGPRPLDATSAAHA
ncbi:MAG TPA: hypothetical protein VN789_14655 [Casimicrobiaceae bacterium]|nr:hypothetical protein [Casimicrobiaceae bacterium]